MCYSLENIDEYKSTRVHEYKYRAPVSHLTSVTHLPTISILLHFSTVIGQFSVENIKYIKVNFFD